MTVTVVKLSFTSPVHVGNGRLSDAECACSADTLFSALFMEAMAQGSQEDLLAVARDGDLLLSDAFPWVGDDCYLPKPYGAPALFASDEESESRGSADKKAFKKLRYLPRDAYGSFFDGTLDAVETLRALDEGLGASGLVTKVDLRREGGDGGLEDGGDAKPYHVGGFHYREGAGLYFIAKGGYDIAPLLESLRYSGLGGKRSAGYGRFEYELTANASDAVPATPGCRVLLSSAAPTADELSDGLLQGARYLLKRRAGFVQSGTYSAEPLKKRDFYAFAAGSTFERTFAGDVFDVSAGGAHPVWRYAKAFWTGEQ